MHAVPPQPLLSNRVLVLLPPNLTNLGGMLACDGLVRMLVPTGDACAQAALERRRDLDGAPASGARRHRLASLRRP